MGDFNISFDKTSVDEGGYSDDPDDSGGETWCAISRNNNPDWRGWLIIDAMKMQPNFPDNLKGLPDLKLAVRECLKGKYWNTFRGDDIPNQKLCNNLYDISVNIGTATAVRWLQHILTIFNRNDPEMFYPDLKIDGNIGPNTMRALFLFVAVEGKNPRKPADPWDMLSWKLNDWQSVHYDQIALTSREKRKYIRGWLPRTRSDE